jgi:DNA-binding transcriptional ArsR family regulator
VHPIRTESRLLAGVRASGAVTALLGATRASILRSVIGGSTTTRMAKLVGVAPATVSHHTGVLRQAGLIATERDLVEALPRDLDRLSASTFVARIRYSSVPRERWDVS